MLEIMKPMCTPLVARGMQHITCVLSRSSHNLANLTTWHPDIYVTLAHSLFQGSTYALNGKGH